MSRGYLAIKGERTIQIEFLRLREPALQWHTWVLYTHGRRFQNAPFSLEQNSLVIVTRRNLKMARKM
jgi:hypothetical protein